RSAIRECYPSSHRAATGPASSCRSTGTSCRLAWHSGAGNIRPASGPRLSVLGVAGQRKEKRLGGKKRVGGKSHHSLRHPDRHFGGRGAGQGQGKEDGPP